MISFGIDPSGSEKRRTGISIIDDDLLARTWITYTDEDIVNAVKGAEPDVVAIDAPLSLPKGRCCANQSCLCSSYGIVRSTDRAISVMGYHPFWTLLPSMVNLTIRSIRLKESIQLMGVKVIEVYPGAAQDRLGVPRKKAGIDKLENGLKALGIHFIDHLHRRVHDELDAVTAAYVGLCYLKGIFEAVGPSDEIQIILPLLNPLNLKAQR